MRDLGHEDVARAEQAARDLHAQGTDVDHVLVHVLRTGNAQARSLAVQVLSRIDGLPDEAVPEVAFLLEDPEDRVRGQAAEALGRLGPRAIPFITPRLEHERAPVREAAAVALWSLGASSLPARDALLAALEIESDPDVIQRMCWAVAVLGEDGAPAIPHLLERMASRNQHIAFAAYDTLGKLGRPAVEPLITTLQSAGTERIGAGAAFALGAIGAPAEAAISALLDALTGRSAYVRRAAAYGLGEIGRRPQEVVPALIERLSDDESSVREHACAALLRFGAEAEPAVPALVQLAETGDEDGAREAVRALGAIGPRAVGAVPLLRARLALPEWGARAGAAAALGRIGPAAKAAVPQLVALLDDDDRIVPRRVAVALFQIDPARARAELERVVPALIAEMDIADGARRTAAVAALGGLGPDARAARGALQADHAACLAILRGEATEFYFGPRAETQRYRDALRAALDAIGPSDADD